MKDESVRRLEKPAQLGGLRHLNADIPQSVEGFLGKEDVASSILAISSIWVGVPSGEGSGL